MKLTERFWNFFKPEKVKELEKESVETNNIATEEGVNVISRTMFNISNSIATVIFTNGSVISGQIKIDEYNKLRSNFHTEKEVLEILVPREKVKSVKSETIFCCY